MEIRTTDVFDDWFARFRDRQTKARIQVRIDRLAAGNAGKFRNLTGGVSEMKIDYGLAIVSTSPNVKGRLLCSWLVAIRPRKAKTSGKPSSLPKLWRMYEEDHYSSLGHD